MVPNGFQHISGLCNFPSDWPVMSADCVTTKITKGTTPPKSEIVQDSNIPFLRVNNLSFNGRLNSSSEMLFVSSDAHEGFLARSIAYPDDILMNIVGPPLGKISMLDKQYDSYNMNQAIVIYRTSPEHIDKYYFLKFLTSELAQQWLQSRSKKTSGQQNLTIQLCKELPVPVPPRLEQRKIAKVLSTWDKAICITERLIDNSKQQKKALMQQLLTGTHTQRKRLLDYSGKPFEGKWEEFHLEEVCSVNPKKSAKPSDGLVSFVPMDAVSEDTKLLRHEVKQYDEVSKGFTSFVNQDCLVAKITPCFENGKGAYVDNLRNGIGFGSTEFHVLRAREGNCTKFIYYITQTREFRVKGEMNMQGSAGQRRVTTDYLKLFKVNIPPTLVEQQKIASVLTNADQEIELLEQQHADLKQEKKALMQQLLTGKRRVKVEQTDLKAN